MRAVFVQIITLMRNKQIFLSSAIQTRLQIFFICEHKYLSMSVAMNHIPHMGRISSPHHFQLFLDSLKHSPTPSAIAPPKAVPLEAGSKVG